MKQISTLWIVIVLLVLGGIGAGVYFATADQTGEPRKPVVARQPVEQPPADMAPTDKQPAAEVKLPEPKPAGTAAAVDPAPATSLKPAPTVETTPPAEVVEKKADSTEPTATTSSRAPSELIVEAPSKVYDDTNSDPFGVTVSGRVVDSKGVGVAGADVSAKIPDAGRMSFNFDSDDVEGAMDPETYSGFYKGYAKSITGTTKSASDGAYSLTVSGRREKGAEKFKFTVAARADGYRAAESGILQMTNQESKADISLRMWKPATIHGIVQVKGTKETFAGASVRAELIVDPKSRSGEATVSRVVSYAREDDSTVSGADGVFEFKDLEPGTYRLVATAPVAGNERMRVATVVTSDISGPDAPAAESGRKLQAVGEGERAGPVVLEVPKPASLMFRLEAPASGTVQIKLDAASGGFGHMTFGMDSGSDYTPDTNGVYRVIGVKKSHNRMSIKAEGFAKTDFSISPVEGEELDLGVLTLKRGATVRGVVTSEGRPVKDAKVALPRNENAFGGMVMMFSGLNADAKTDMVTSDDGKFEIENVEDGTFAMSVTHDDYARADLKVGVTEGKDPAFLEVKLYAGGSVSGGVKLPPQPTAGAGGDGENVIEYGTASGNTPFVALVAETSGAGALDAWGMDSIKWMAGSSKHRADIALADGSYRITKVPPGKYTAAAVAYGKTSVKKGIVIEDGREVKIDFAFDTLGSVEGEIIGSDGKPMAGSEVYVNDNPWGRANKGKYAGTTDATGHYKVEGVPTGTWYLMLPGESNRMSEDYRDERRFEITEANTKAVLNLDLRSKGAVVKGKVLGGGKPLFKNAYMISTGGKPVTRDTNFAEDGSFEIRDVPPGRYYLWFQAQAMGNGETVARLAVEVGTDDKEKVVERDFAVGTLAGAIKGGGEGFDYASVKVALMPVYDAPFGPDQLLGMIDIKTNGRTDATYRFNTIVEGSYRMSVSAPGIASVVSDVTVGTATTKDVSLGGKPGVLEVTVVKVEGIPASEDATGAGAASFFNFGMLKLLLADGSSLPIDEESRYVMNGFTAGKKITLGDLPPGEYTLEMSSGAIETARLNVSIKPDETSKYDVTLYKAAEIKLTVTNAELDAAKVKAASVAVKDASGQSVNTDDLISAMIGSGGASKTITLKALSAGTYTITVNAKGYKPFVTTVTVARSGSESREITLEADPAAAGK